MTTIDAGQAAGVVVVAAEPERTARTARTWRLSPATVAVFAVTIALADGFWITSLHTTVGAVPHVATDPVVRFGRAVAVMLPLHALVTWGSLRLARRWVGRRREMVRLACALGFVVIGCTLLTVGEAGALAWWDYGFQSGAIDVKHAGHSIIGACLGSCAAKEATLDAHLRGVGLVGVTAFVTNAVLGVWVLSLRGGQLWVPARNR